MVGNKILKSVEKKASSFVYFFFHISLALNLIISSQTGQYTVSSVKLESVRLHTKNKKNRLKIHEKLEHKHINITNTNKSQISISIACRPKYLTPIVFTEKYKLQAIYMNPSEKKLWIRKLKAEKLKTKVIETYHVQVHRKKNGDKKIKYE